MLYVPGDILIQDFEEAINRKAGATARLNKAMGLIREGTMFLRRQPDATPTPDSHT